MTIYIRLLIALLLLEPQIGLAAESGIPSLKPGATYAEAKTWHEQFMGGNPTKSQRLDAMRTLILASPARSRGMEQIYHNFEGRYSIDPTIPGVEDSVLKQLSGSRQQAKGYRREVLYAVAYHNDPRFNLNEMNKPLKRSWGNTDADLVFTHKETGMSGRIEVKDYSLKSQKSNLPKLKHQIDKMALEGRKTGQKQFWMNSRGVIPEIWSHANHRGVFVSANVKTGKTVAPDSIHISEAMTQQEHQFYRTDRNRLVIGSGGFAFGSLMLYDALPRVVHDLSALDSSGYATNQWLRAGESLSSVTSGAGMVVSGGAFIATKYASDVARPSLYSTGRIGGYVGLFALGAGEAFQISRYMNGDVLSQEFWTNQWVMGSASAGALSGGWVGFLLAKGPMGTVAGSSIGGALGQTFGRNTAQHYYEYKFGELDRAFGKWVYARYSVAE